MKKIFKAITAPIVLLFKTLKGQMKLGVKTVNRLHLLQKGAREFVEDRIADVLDRVQESDKVDEVEKKLITAGIKAGITYYCNACPLDDEKINVISDTIVEKGINKINPAVSKQLRK